MAQGRNGARVPAGRPYGPESPVRPERSEVEPSGETERSRRVAPTVRGRGSQGAHERRPYIRRRDERWWGRGNRPLLPTGEEPALSPSKGRDEGRWTPVPPGRPREAPLHIYSAIVGATLGVALAARLAPDARLNCPIPIANLLQYPNVSRGA